jgi:hypothetical protein
MMATTRRHDPWHRQAARGVGFVVGLALAVFVVGAAISAVFVFVMG